MMFAFVVGLAVGAAVITAILVANIRLSISVLFESGQIDCIEYAGDQTGKLSLKVYKEEEEVLLFHAFGEKLVCAAVWTLRNNPNMRKVQLTDMDEWRLTPA